MRVGRKRCGLYDVGYLMGGCKEGYTQVIIMQSDGIRDKYTMQLLLVS